VCDSVSERDLGDGLLSAYRWQYLASGIGRRFLEVLGELIEPAPERLQRALEPLLAAAA
jgi:hypothetical protein